MEALVQKQKAFFESGNTLDTRSRRAILQILANTVKDVCGDDTTTTAALLAQVKDFRDHLYKWTGTGRLRLLLSLFANPGGSGRVPQGTVLIDGGAAEDAGAILAPLVSALAAGNTAVVLVPDSPVGETVSRIVDETFTDDFVATAPAASAPAVLDKTAQDGGAEAADKAGFNFVYRCGDSLPCLGYDGFLTFSKLILD